MPHLNFSTRQIRVVGDKVDLFVGEFFGERFDHELTIEWRRRGRSGLFGRQTAAERVLQAAVVAHFSGPFRCTLVIWNAIAVINHSQHFIS